MIGILGKPQNQKVGLGILQPDVDDLMEMQVRSTSVNSITVGFGGPMYDWMLPTYMWLYDAIDMDDLVDRLVRLSIYKGEK